jgi:hypothetical protein
MDSKELRGLMEAYSEVYAPEQLDELSVNKMLAYGKAAQKDRDVLNKKWDEKKASHKEKMRVLGHEEGEDRAAEKIKKKTGKYPHQMNALDKARYAVTKEELDIFDVVLEFLQAEGYAETLEEAEWMMANLIDEEAIAIVRWEKRKRGAELGKRKAERKAAEEQNEEYVDEALTGERYKKAVKKPGGTAYSRMVSADPKKRATRGGRGGESDFGAGDRGSGNKAARRAGTYQEYSVNEHKQQEKIQRSMKESRKEKSAPVRGEKTPMPPRGDKRREDFEKWYANTQMGR